MRRRSSPKPQAGGVSLFPFLAVLLCTMGALIVVLIVIARQARIQVAEDVDDSPQRAELETQKADLQWRIEMLRESRSKTLAQLETQREELSHLEDHSRRLRSQLEELEHARSEFEKLAAGGDVETERLKREIDEISAKIAAKERELDEALKKGGKGGQSYAVVPYHGPNETRRRPIYIECRSDGVVLQPEGLVLTEKDFEGDLGPGSPLVSALRAAREYLSRNQLPGEEGAPYPLILVRPDGIVAYEVVQASMESWGSEYGYELVGDDWELEFPPADPKLTLAMRQAIGEGRLRQAYLAHAAPRLRSATGHHSYRASPTGGLMRDDGMPINAESQMARGGSARPSWARGGRSAGAGGPGRSGGSAQAGAAPKRSANPYAAALHGQSGAGGGGGGSGMTLGSGEGSLLGVGAGDLAGGQLNAAPGSPTGVLFRAPGGGVNGAGPGGAAGTNGGGGNSLLGSGVGTSAVPSDNLLAGGGNGGPKGRGFATGQSGAPSGMRGYGGAPGTQTGGGQAGRGAGGRGWGAGQDKIDAVAASLGARPGNAPAEKPAGGGLGGAGAPAGSGEKGSGPGQSDKPGNAAPAGALAATKAGGPGGSGGGGAAQGPDLGSAQPNGSAEGSEGVEGSMAGGPSDKPGGKPGGKAPEGNASGGDGSGSAEGVASNGSSTDGAKSGGASSKAAGSKNSTPGGGGSGSQASSLAGAQSAGAAGTSSMASAGGGGAGQPQQPGAMAMPVPMPNMTFGDKSQQKSIADQRGEKNWANPAANHAAFPVTRPIKIVCDSDHLTLLPEGRSRRGYKVIELGESKEENVRELVTSVWDRIETWGIAGQGMYWRPELIMEVEPGAEDRFNELKALMADSGLDVRGRPRSATAIRYPRTKTPN